jgi:RND family efflux transporter MFP subunit
MGLRTALVTRGPLRRKIRTVGAIDFDETSLADVTTKIKGWVETLYVDSTGQQVHKGDPLFEFYSPELYSAQTEYLLVLNQLTNSASPGAAALKADAITKLKYYDVSDAQIAELESTRAAKKTLRINAPRDGVVVEKMVVQGQMVDPGTRLYRLADLGVVWLQAQIYEQDLPFIQLGQEAVVSLSYLPDRKFRGRVTYVYPTVDDKTRTARVRMEFHNPGYYLKPGMFATVELESLLADDAILVPDSAVLRSGEKNTVFIALSGGRFEPRTVTLGARGEDDQYQVLAGLKDGARVVTSGQFMLDSESQLREAIQKMQEPPGETDAAPAATNAPAAISTLAGAPDAKIVAYVCPMPEHVAIQYDHPGDCPICGMKLVPVTAETLGKIHPGGEVDYYVCPMPEHSTLHRDKPGKCPICGMTLIPIMKAAPLPKAAETNAMEPGHSAQ